MERILITFIRFDFYIIKVTAHTKNYVEFESLYPIKGIKGDYYSEDENFYENSSIPLIKKFVYSVTEAFARLPVVARFFVKYIEDSSVTNDRQELEILVDKYIEKNNHHTEFKYFSNGIKNSFREMHFQFFLTRTFPFENVFVMDDDLKVVQNCLDLVLVQGIKEVVIIDYRNENFAGTQVSKIINLNDGKFPEEQLLQAMLICNYSAPRLDKDKDPFQYEDFFEERFNSFSDQKKLGLFMVCQENKGLFLYKKCLAKFWINRY